MTLSELLAKTDLTPIYVADDSRAVTGAYAGDLLSWVMGRAEADNAFLTIMTNVNVVAVASLAELSCIIFCEDVQVSDDIIAAAKEKNINLLKSVRPTFETAVSLSFLSQ